MSGGLLNEAEQRFLDRQMRGERLFLVLSVVGIAVAAGFTLVMMTSHRFDGKAFALTILILLQARSNLKQHKSAKIFKKITGSDQQP